MSKAFIRTYIRTNKYKNFYRHNFFIWKNTNELNEKLDNLYLPNNSMIYVSNGYLMLNLENKFNNLNINDHIKFIKTFIKQKQEELGKTWFKNILNILNKNKTILWIISTVEYIDEITLDYDSWLPLLENININDLSKYQLDNVLDLSKNNSLINLIINKSIKKKDKIWNLFIWFKEHINYVWSILKNYNFLILDKIFITKYLDWIDIKNFQITFKIKERAQNKIIYNTLFDKITKGIYDKALKSSGQLKIYKVWSSLKRQIKIFWQNVNLKIKQYYFNTNEIKTIESISLKNVILQNSINKNSKEIDISNYKNKQYSLNNNLIYDEAIKNIFSIVHFIKNYYLWIIEKNIPEYKNKIDSIILKFSDKLIEKLMKDLDKIKKNVNLKNLYFLQSLSFIKENELNKIKLLKHILKNLTNLYNEENDNKNIIINIKILNFLNDIIQIHQNYYKLLQQKYKKNKMKNNTLIKKYGLLLIKLKYNKDKNQIKLLIWLIWNVFKKEDIVWNFFENKIKKNKNIYYNYISFYNDNFEKNNTLKYKYKKELSFSKLSLNFYKIFENENFDWLKIKKHDFLNFLINLITKTLNKIEKKFKNINNFNNYIIYSKKIQDFKNYIEYLENIKKWKNILYDKKKVIMFLKQNTVIMEWLFNVFFKIEWKVSKSIFLIQKEFFNLIKLKQNTITKKEITNKKLIKKNNNYELNIERKIITKIKDNYLKNYFDWNRYKFITWTFFYLKNKVNYYSNTNNKIWKEISLSIAHNITDIINIESFIDEHWIYIIDNLKRCVPV